MDSGGDGATPGPASAMSVDDAWDLRQGELQPLAHNRDTILADIERTLKNHNNSPVSYLEAKYSSVEAKEKYAEKLKNAQRASRHQNKSRRAQAEVRGSYTPRILTISGRSGRCVRGDRRRRVVG